MSSSSTNVTVGGVSFTIQGTAQASKTLSAVVITKEARHDISVPVYEKNKLKERCVAEEQLEDGQLLDLTAVTNQASLKEVYDATQIINQIRSHLKKYNMLTCFTIIVPSKDRTGAIEGVAPTDHFDLFTQYSKVTKKNQRRRTRRNGQRSLGNPIPSVP